MAKTMTEAEMKAETKNLKLALVGISEDQGGG